MYRLKTIATISLYSTRLTWLQYGTSESIVTKTCFYNATYLTFLSRYGEFESFGTGLRRGEADDWWRLCWEPWKPIPSIFNETWEPCQSALSSELEGYFLSMFITILQLYYIQSVWKWARVFILVYLSCFQYQFVALIYGQVITFIFYTKYNSI